MHHQSDHGARVTIRVVEPKADLWFEASFSEPALELLSNQSALLQRLYLRLERHGLRLVDMRVERGTGAVGDHHVVCHLFNFLMTLRVRPDRIEVNCAALARDHVERYHDAIVGALTVVKELHDEISFRGFAFAVGLHAKLEAGTVQDFLARFVGNAPRGLGPPTGNGAVFYFGAESNRLLSSITVDLSTQISGGLYVRVHTVWDPQKVQPEALTVAGDEVIRKALEALGLEPLA